MRALIETEIADVQPVPTACCRLHAFLIRTERGTRYTLVDRLDDVLAPCASGDAAVDVMPRYARHDCRRLAAALHSANESVERFNRQRAERTGH